MKETIVADIFGRQSGTVFEAGLADASSRDMFVKQLGQLEEPWSVLHQNGRNFFKWFHNHKSADFVNCVISPVRQRAGLGCPPEKFTTNRSEATNNVSQDFVLRESHGKKKVDEHSFASSVEKLVNIQKEDIELAVVGRGEYKLREEFRYLEVSPSKWSQMRDDQRKAVLQKIHETNIHEMQQSSVTQASNALPSEAHPIMQKILSIGIDWIPRDVLSAIVNKSDSLNKEHHFVMPQINETVVVPSKSNPRDPHVVNLFANGKAECAKCPGFAAFSICAHTLAACFTIDRLEDFLRWLVSTKRNSGGFNLSAAVAYGMPKGRGRKRERAPRKRSVGNQKPVSKVVSRLHLTTTAATIVFSHTLCPEKGKLYRSNHQTSSSPFSLNIARVSCFLAPLCPTKAVQTQFFQVVSLPLNNPSSTFNHSRPLRRLCSHSRPLRHLFSFPHPRQLNNLCKPISLHVSLVSHVSLLLAKDSLLFTFCNTVLLRPVYALVVEIH